MDSVAEQTYWPLELIVVDDGSQPPLAESLSLPEEKLRRVVLDQLEENRGANVARARGIELAKGKYLAFLDSDDEWLPEKVERQVARLEKHRSLQASYTGVKHLDDRGRLNAVSRPARTGHLLEPLLRGNVIGSFTLTLVERTAVDAVGAPDPDMPCWQDWEWYLRLAGAEVEFDAISEPLALKYGGADRISRSYVSKRDEAYPILRERIGTLAPTAQQARIGLAYLDFRLGYSALVNQHYADARRRFVAAIRSYPRDPRFYLYLASAGRHYHWLRAVKREAMRLLSS